ncbi:MAG: TauD/TfdA family dioxygenase [Deltaproteobacteria bacterium]|jgi:taurine dioxygenase|nr:TauD/TfdA family dioxygenase [Deltaproteobacteria bacterium]MBW2498342.1 TauD/TfdA family dioxygenase [Deltaproteobacteria bacterium]
MTVRSVPKGLEVKRLTGSLGAEIRGLELAQAGPADVEWIRSLMNEHLVLFFPDQNLSPDEHIAFGRLFGPLEAHPNLPLGAERPEFFELRASGGAGAIADEWHSDLSCQARPSLLAILQVRKCPPVGGDTLWANMYRAYEALSPPIRDLCEGLTALHDASPHGKPEIKAIHPVVRVHPETGRKSLFVNEHFTRRIVELSHDESEMLLQYLIRWVTRARFTVRYHWHEGTVALWDNRCTQHHVLDDFEGERVIQRVTVMGDEPRSESPPRWEPFSTAFSASSWRDESLRSFLRDERASS